MVHRTVAVLALLAVCCTPALAAATQGGPIPLPLPLFPQNNWWNLDISSAPLDPASASYIGFIGLTRQMHPDFGGDDLDVPGNVYGIPFIVVDGAQAKKTVDFVLYGDQSDGVNHDTEEPFPFYPVPDEAITMNGWVEGGQPGNVDQREDSDRHLLMVDKDNNHLYELYNVWFNGTMWEAGSGAFFDMSENGRRPEGWTSADAAGLAILPGLVRYDEVFGPDEIRHALRVTVRATNGHVYPASHTAGSTSGALPMGARLRLKASKNISGYAPEVQKIFRAMKKYGLIVADNGSDLYVSGAYDTRWDNDVLNPAFHSLRGSDFEVVQLGWHPTVTFVLTLPNPVAANEAATATLTAYNADYTVATGYRGTVHFTSTDGAATLPSDYTFTAADNGAHTFPAGFTLRTPGSQTVTFTDVANATITGSAGASVGPATPAGLAATATTATSVSVTWTPTAGATQWEVVRGSNAPVLVATTSYTDTTAVANTSYVYRVRALDSSGRPSPFSAPDAATTILFTDDPLVAASTKTKAVHLTQLRQAVNAMRTAAGLPAATFTDPTLSSAVKVKAAHFQELRNALAPARAALGLTALTFTDASLVAGSTRIKAAHVQELRGGVR
ncbi:MAG TPA: hypothetical protein VGF28_04385 [Thermoanaerobaculia bacterium]|jgi:hypothetical protein